MDYSGGTLMILFNLFLRLNLRSPTTSVTDTELEQLSSQMLTQADLTFAHKKITAAYREAPLLRHAYDAFLTHCRDALGKQSKTAMLPIIIDYLTGINASLEDTRAHTHIILTLFNLHLHEQASALSVMPLGRCFIDSPKAFAAFIQWLMQHKVSPDEVLQAHLLQDYLRYHLYSLNSPENPIKLLYTLLSQNSDTKALAEKATKARCPEEGLASYALDGTIHAPGVDTLDNPSLKKPDTEITLKETNLKALHRVFGVPFLVGALRWYSDDKHNNIPAPTLLTLFNGLHVTHQDFTFLLQHLREHEHLKKTLATLLLNTTLDELIDARISGIPSLILYSDYLADKISGEDLTTYMHDIKQASTSHLDLIADLSAFLKTFEKRNKAHALLAFDHLFEVILEHPEVLDDKNLLRQFRKFKPAKERLVTHSAWLENSFNTFVHTHTNMPMEAFDYISIEDMWREMHPKFDAIQTIENIPNTFPSDKYKLQCRLLNAFLPRLGQFFILDDFIQQLGIDPTFDAHEIMPYERLLIEMLVSADDTSLRLDVINRLDTNIPKTRPWYNLHIDNSSLYMHAAHHGNLGFIMWLKSHNVKQSESYETLTREAVDLKHWPLVQYFHQTSNLNHLVVDDLLKLAVEQNAYEAILPLWQGKKCAPRLPMVQICFDTAVKENRINCVQALLACPMPPCDTSITKGYKTAIRTQQTAIINMILSAAETQHLPCLNKAISKEASRRKLPKLVGVKSCDNFIHPCCATRNQEALAQHGLFKKKPDMSRSYNSLVLPPLLSRQTSL
jgi:hypothetical protein